MAVIAAESGPNVGRGAAWASAIRAFGSRWVRLLLIEDDEKIAAFVLKGMQQAGFVIDHAGDGVKGLEMALGDAYDGAIVDIMLPRLDGLALIETLRNRKINLPVIILSAKRSVDDRIKGLQQGGDDYLTKPFAFSELLARVQALLRRASNTTESTSLVVHDLSLDLLARTAIRAGKKINLQPKEFSLLEYLMRNAGRIVSKTMIMERVWDYNFDPSTNLVEARICHLREKVDKGFDAPLIHTVRGLGYVLRKQDEADS
jgi:two-component system OmpR family response regulator